ncbi:MAG: hypothetical protein QNJ94_15250 [Alphaproteobacteria bacterium]|nr:hypothetical protein [Alphaproteobacteria bacterium]
MQFIRSMPGLLLGLSLSVGAASLAQAQTKAPAVMETGTNVYMEPAFKQFDAHLADCTKKTGYDPDNVPKKVGKFALAPGEDAWRACAYQGVENILIPQSRAPGLYRSLVDTHKILTTQMQRKIVTRDERRAKIEALIVDIQIEEAKQMSRASSTPPKKTEAERNEWMRRQVDALRGLGSG